jgi:hypothetical protein
MWFCVKCHRFDDSTVKRFDDYGQVIQGWVLAEQFGYDLPLFRPKPGVFFGFQAINLAPLRVCGIACDVGAKQSLFFVDLWNCRIVGLSNRGTVETSNRGIRKKPDLRSQISNLKSYVLRLMSHI